jgi:hypothetical protein
MATGVAETVTEHKGPQQVSRPRRRPPATESDGAQPRFFLAGEAKSGQAPDLGRELQNEAEALVESLKTGKPFYTVLQYRGVADCSSAKPQIRKEAV